jgi:hypothetical protein
MCERRAECVGHRNRVGVTGFYRGLLSGLVRTGAFDPPKRPATRMLDVGAALMTAEEVAELDLRGCEMAIVSVRETALGRTAGGEWVLGLQRALHQAGCRTADAGGNPRLWAAWTSSGNAGGPPRARETGPKGPATP